MANDNYTQQALAADTHFRQRVRAAMSSVAWQVQGEDPATPNHAARVQYAQRVIRNLDAEVAIILPTFVMRPNVNNFATTYVFDFVYQTGQVANASSDADLLSQLSSDWDAMAAAAGYSGAATMGVLPPMPI
jgi:hypothetical protein